MKKAHLDYLKKAVNIAINLKEIADVPAQISQLRCYRPPIYGLIRDIASDTRFYGVTENTPFWHRYALATVHDFIESITPEEWNDPEKLLLRKEDFLYSWFCEHSLPLSADKEKEIELDLQAKGWMMPESRKAQEEDESTLSGLFDFIADGSITDYTHQTPQSMSGAAKDYKLRGVEESYPANILNYMAEANKPYKGNAPGMEAEPHRAEAVFMSKIDPSLGRLAKMIGRSGGTVATEVKGKFQHSRRSDISGVTVGADLGSLLPIELALLSNQSTEDLFYRKYTQKRLQVFSSSSLATEAAHDKKGAIFMCVDTSSSMSGEPEMMAKMFALAVAIIAQRERRPVCVINYAYEISFFILRNLDTQRTEFLKFLGHSYGGGNNENMLFEFLFKKLPSHPRYSKYRQYFKNADLLVVSDFIWYGLSDTILSMITAAKDEGMKLYTLSVRNLDKGEFEEESDSLTFQTLCDHNFLYSAGRVKEVKLDKPKYIHHAPKNEASGRHRLHAGKLRARTHH